RLVHPDPSSPVADQLYRRLLATYFHPTIVYDRAATERMRQELRRSVDVNKYTIRHGEKIIGANEVIGRDDYEKLRALQEQMQGAPGGMQVVARASGAILMNLLLVLILGISLAMFRPQLYAAYRQLLLMALVFLAVLAAAALIANQSGSVHVELIPIALAAVMFSVLFDSRISVLAAMVLALLIGAQNVFRGTNALYLQLIGGVAAAFSVRIIRRRNQASYSILTIAAAYGLATLAIGLSLGRGADEMVRVFALCALNAVVSVSLAMILLPPAEELTGIDTYLRLLEWSDLNRPLMQRLSLEAPGTYAHTMQMANLVEAAANAIGANGLLARVGTYYHDIGKLKKPQYFVENQTKGRNPHDKLKPTTSAAIIRNHIRDGLELAEEYKLPRAVRSFITEHHGTGAISYFLDKARDRAEGEPPNASEFVYPGPIPQSAETAICMLADGVEASTRVLTEPTPEKIREVVDHIVRQRLEQGQLAAAPLTMRQLEAVKAEFVRVLSGMYHNRIDYPTSSGGVTSEFAAV
ncbi:MAG TPA: HDIG domain-containing protein, partial [Gemmatimonadaceae bacterium]|nr:HDIG domain-containing protein [Gemmatimonadaceae bacterium]